MRIRTTIILATAAAAASMVLLAGCGGDGPEGAPPPPATTKAAPARNAAADTPRKIFLESPQQREAFLQGILQCVTACAGGISPNSPHMCIETLSMRLGIIAWPNELR
jgi:hypothetical protein